MKLNPNIARIARFLVVGGVVMLFFMGMTWAFSKVVSEQAAFLIPYPMALALHFALNKWWTFADQSALRRGQVGEYALMVAVTFLIQWSVYTAVTRWTEVPNWIATGIAIVAQMAVTFLAMSRRIFAPARSS